MYAHFMAPERLDPTYTHWIQKLSNIAPEAVTINRQLVREGKFDVELLEKIIARKVSNFWIEIFRFLILFV